MLGEGNIMLLVLLSPTTAPNSGVFRHPLTQVGEIPRKFCKNQTFDLVSEQVQDFLRAAGHRLVTCHPGHR